MTKTLEISRGITLLWKIVFTKHRFCLEPDPDSSVRTSRLFPAGCDERPINICGLSCTDQGGPEVLEKTALPFGLVFLAAAGVTVALVFAFFSIIALTCVC